MISKYRRAQLFVIEVIVALTVLIVLVSILFTPQSLSPPPNQSDLAGDGQNALSLLVKSGNLWKYFEAANYSYYDNTTGIILDANNDTKQPIANTIRSSIPLIANFKAFVYRYNNLSDAWDRIDILNYEAYTPSGIDVEVVEYYFPGYYDLFIPFKFQLNLWFEVVI